MTYSPSPAILNALSNADTTNPIIKALLNAIGIEDIQCFYAEASNIKNGVITFPRAFSKPPTLILSQNFSHTTKTPTEDFNSNYIQFQSITESSFKCSLAQIYISGKVATTNPNDYIGTASMEALLKGSQSSPASTIYPFIAILFKEKTPSSNPSGGGPTHVGPSGGTPTIPGGSVENIALNIRDMVRIDPDFHQRNKETLAAITKDLQKQKVT